MARGRRRASSAGGLGGPKKVAVPMTVVWPTVKWNLEPVLHAALKKRIWRTLMIAVEMKCM